MTLQPSEPPGQGNKNSFKNLQWKISFRCSHINIISFPSNLSLWPCPSGTDVNSSKHSLFQNIYGLHWEAFPARQTHIYLYTEHTELSVWGWFQTGSGCPAPIWNSQGQVMWTVLFNILQCDGHKSPRFWFWLSQLLACGCIVQALSLTSLIIIILMVLLVIMMILSNYWVLMYQEFFVRVSMFESATLLLGTCHVGFY